MIDGSFLPENFSLDAICKKKKKNVCYNQCLKHISCHLAFSELSLCFLAPNKVSGSEPLLGGTCQAHSVKPFSYLCRYLGICHLQPHLCPDLCSFQGSGASLHYFIFFPAFLSQTSKLDITLNPNRKDTW